MRGCRWVTVVPNVHHSGELSAVGGAEVHTTGPAEALAELETDLMMEDGGAGCKLRVNYV